MARMMNLFDVKNDKIHAYTLKRNEQFVDSLLNSVTKVSLAKGYTTIPGMEIYFKKHPVLTKKEVDSILLHMATYCGTIQDKKEILENFKKGLYAEKNLIAVTDRDYSFDFAMLFTKEPIEYHGDFFFDDIILLNRELYVLSLLEAKDFSKLTSDDLKIISSLYQCVDYKELGSIANLDIVTKNKIHKNLENESQFVQKMFIKKR